MLIEVMVGALMLALITTAVLTGLDGAQETGRKNRNRSVAATLAQQDIERLRAMPVTALSNFSQTRTVDANGVNYTVASTTEWVSDSTGVISCSDETEQADYLKVSSTVSSPATVSQPVVETTLLAPAAGTGAVVVRLTDRDGLVRPSTSVSLAGSTYSTSQATNTLGCAIFGGVPAGNYTARAPGGLVSWASVNPATSAVTVATGKTSVVQMELEPPASLLANFVKPSGAPAAPTAAWGVVSVAHAKLPGGRKVFTGATGTSLAADTLFPHHDGYGVYAGGCKANNPANWDADYFLPGGPGYVQLDPSDVNKPVNVVMAAPRVTVRRSSGSGGWTAHARFDEADDPALGSTCTTSRAGFQTNNSGSTSTKNLDFALPFGTYDVCADDSSRRRTVSVTLSPTDPAPTPVTVDLTSGTSSGRCPT
ncbi:MAG TPA: hypothetical protein VGF25_15360 [Thermoleophilaceae bacterium]|jgi:Tfp pilus assembly protein PilV